MTSALSRLQGVTYPPRSVSAEEPLRRKLCRATSRCRYHLPVENCAARDPSCARAASSGVHGGAHSVQVVFLIFTCICRWDVGIRPGLCPGSPHRRVARAPRPGAGASHTRVDFLLGLGEQRERGESPDGLRFCGCGKGYRYVDKSGRIRSRAARLPPLHGSIGYPPGGQSSKRCRSPGAGTSQGGVRRIPLRPGDGVLRG